VLRGRITAGRLDGAAFEQAAELQQIDLRIGSREGEQQC
jgi:hypothetical protein